GQFPGIVEFGDHGAHERRVERERAGVVAEMVGEQRQRELGRAAALVGPFEPGRRQALQVITWVERRAVDGDFGAGETAAADIGLHATPLTTPLEHASVRWNRTLPLGRA